MRYWFLLIILLWIPPSVTEAQTKPRVDISGDNKRIIAINGFELLDSIPFFYGEINNSPFLSFEFEGSHFNNQIELKWQWVDTFSKAAKARLIFTNISKDTIQLSNILVFGKSAHRPFITGLGEHWLSRTHLFLPNKKPINIIVPDNAWELGYSTVPLFDTVSAYALTRRVKWTNATRRRFLTLLHPNGSVEYDVYIELYHGEWQNGVKKAFHERLLYDLDSFDNTLFDRPDLSWIRHTYTMHLIMAWDDWLYAKNDYRLLDFLKKGKTLYGGNDVVAIWPTWPTLGLDQRNQFDLFKDLPGGLARLKKLARQCRAAGTKFFICYNPWDESTSGSEKGENHLSGLSKLIKETDADGVVLDTRGASSKELQAAADAVKKGVIMYSEGMAIPKDMPSIVSGRVHNALYYPPFLNFNKLIKPDFAIYRVAELFKEPIRREFATAFFNGYGTEINVFKNGKPDWINEQYRYLGRTSRILREHTKAFTSAQFTPLIPTLRDSIYVNRWQDGDKTVYTILSFIPQGVKELLFEVDSTEGYHFVDVWHHQTVQPKKLGNRFYIEADTDAFHQKDLGTNNEGAVDCIVRFKNHLTVQLDIENDSLFFSTDKGDVIKIWAGAPAYDKEPIILKTTKGKLKLSEKLGRFEGKIIVQVFDNKNIIDEKIVEILSGVPRKISLIKKTPFNKNNLKSMVSIPDGTYVWEARHGDDWVTYPDQDTGKTFSMPRFWMDKNLVSNGDFERFIRATRYRPKDTTRFVQHCRNGNLPNWRHYPVVNISYEDACAYCQWQGKRLPTEREWQYAAQYPDNRKYPWGNHLDSTRCNTGNGKLDLIGAYPTGANTLGLLDLVGNVWQLTHDVYQNGSYRYLMLKGGSHFKPTASWWYVQGGVQPLSHRQILLRVSEGFERNATVGFRCVMDAR